MMVFFRYCRANILSPLCAGGHWLATQAAKRVSDQNNQYNNGPHHDQTFDNPAALCLAVWTKSQIWEGGCGTYGLYEGSRPVSLFLSVSLFSFSFPSLFIMDLLCLRSTRCKYASAINYLLVFLYTSVLILFCLFVCLLCVRTPHQLKLGG